jgi:2,3-bisphosphoglycerate-independent phosphoglycerate mutase
MKTILLICDGMADRGCKLLGGATPLEVARAKSFDMIAEKGECGIMDPIAPGVIPGSDTSHLAIFGYNPYEYYSGRGAYEALGAGITLKKGDVAFRCNFATVNDDDIIIDRRAGRISGEDAKELAKALNEIDLSSFTDAKVEFYHTIEHRGVLVIRGKNLSPYISDIDIHKTGVRIPEAKPLKNTEEAKRTAEILNEYISRARVVLEDHEINVKRKSEGLLPANVILPRGAGTLPKVKSFKEKYELKAAAIAGGTLYKGIAKALGFDIIEVEGATGTVNTNLDGKMEATIKALDKYDFVFLHIKGCDSASHDKNIKLKISMIRRIGTAFEYVLKNIDINQTYLIVTSDHTTPVEIGEHRGDPVPIAIYGPDVRTDSVKYFDEKSCAKGGLNRIRGLDIMPIITNYMGISKIFGE